MLTLIIKTHIAEIPAYTENREDNAFNKESDPLSRLHTTEQFIQNTTLPSKRKKYYKLRSNV